MVPCRSTQASQQVNESVNDLHVLCTFRSFHQICANLFQDFPFSLASVCTLYFISKLNARSILNVNGCVAKSASSWLLSTNGLIQIVMRLVGLANEKPRRC